jgi:hypothetical protein
MSWTAISWAKQVQAGGPGPKAVLLCLADRADEEDSCFPSQELLAQETEQSVRTVQRQLADLETKGLIKRVHRARSDGNGRTSDRYFLLGVQGVNLSPDNLSRKGSLTRQMEGGLHDTGVVGTIKEPSKDTSRKPKPKPHTFPEGWTPTQAHQEYGHRHQVNLSFAAEQFENWHRGKGSEFVDWDRAFTTWLSKERQRIEKAKTGYRPQSTMPSSWG